MDAERVLQIAEEDWRRRLIDTAPQIKADVDRMADLIREMVKLEREKRGFDKPSGTVELRPNKEKKTDSQPDLTGSGFIAGRSYRAAAWISNDKCKVSLLPRTQK